jgi:hypothetical protein
MTQVLKMHEPYTWSVVNLEPDASPLVMQAFSMTMGLVANIA